MCSVCQPLTVTFFRNVPNMATVHFSNTRSTYEEPEQFPSQNIGATIYGVREYFSFRIFITLMPNSIDTIPTKAHKEESHE